MVGSGVSGLTAAHVLARTHQVTLLEADDRFGGHAHTHRLTDLPGANEQISVDTGFIVHNDRTYPTLLRLFDELGVRTQATEMSMSVRCDGCGLEYAGGKGPSGLLGRARSIADPRYLRMLAEVPRFHRAARAVLADDSQAAQLSWGEFLAAGRFTDYTIRHYAVPLVACVWSCGDGDAMAYPARHLFAFLDHHGMLSLGGSPTWRTVIGGSNRYVEALVARLPDARVGAPVAAVQRHEDGVTVRLAAGAALEADVCVVATHADTALDILVDATPEEKSWLGSIGYSRNETWLHRDESVLPRQSRARASWNYRMRSCAPQTPHAPQVLVSYWMNRLMHLDTGTGPGSQLLVTLNPAGWVKESSVLARMVYSHPIFTHDAVRAAASLREAGGPRLAFAGAHLGWGFHEDGARSGAAAASRLGGRW